jgi:glutathione S-transferase
MDVPGSSSVPGLGRDRVFDRVPHAEVRCRVRTAATAVARNRPRARCVSRLGQRDAAIWAGAVVAPALLPLGAMRVGTLEEAREARGLRLVVMAGVPSPWSEAAKGWFEVKGVDALLIRLTPRDADIRAWTGHHNAPVAMYEDEPPRAGWSEILALAERLAPTPRLVPEDATARAEMMELTGAILGEGGLVWSLRLCLIHESLVTEGARGFPLNAARYLAAKYGYAPERIEPARARAVSVLDDLGRRLADGRRYLLGDTLSGVDIVAATALGIVQPMPEELCPMLPVFRAAYESQHPEIRDAASPASIAHRDFIYQQHLRLPVIL